MYWKHGLALAAMMAVTLSAGTLKAQQREDDQSRAAAAAGAQQAGAQDRDDAPRAGAQDRTGAQQRTGAQGQAGAQRQFGAQGQAGAQGQGQGRQGRGQMFEQHLAFCLALGNQAEIQLGQLASQKAQNPQVKEFAQRMVQDHTQYLQQLQQFLPPGQADTFRSDSSATGAAARTSPDRSTTSAAAQERTDQERAGQQRAQERRDDANRDDNQSKQNRADDNQANATQTPGAQPTQRRADQADQAGQAGQRQGGQGGGLMIAFERDAAQRCLQMTREMLNEHQGHDFDMAYIGQQIVAHTQMLSKLEAAQNRVSPEFQEVIRKGVQSTNQHLKEARTISDTLASNQGGQQRGQGRRGQQPGAGRAPGAGQENPGAGQPQ
jgi:predicted outer membrane protein